MPTCRNIALSASSTIACGSRTTSDRLMAAGVAVSGRRVEIGAVRSLFDTRPGGVGYFYDVSPDGQRFLVNAADREPAPALVTVVVSWTASLEK